MSAAATLDDASLRRIAAVVQAASGIELRAEHRDLVRSRLGPRLRHLGIRSYRQYVDLVERGGPQGELAFVLDAISTNLTRFMREEQHFEELRERVINRCKESGPTRKGKLRLWSAACSSGEEPYSMAIAVAEALESLVSFDIRILATDLSRRMLAKASRGEYEAAQLAGIPATVRAKYFAAEGPRSRGVVRVRPELRRLVTFSRLNLIEEWPMRRGFDAIFCRNVMIYFDEATRRRLTGKLVRALNPDGLLFIGHSETVDGHSPALEKVASAVYRRSAKRQGVRRAG